jgi:hypothetical protein
MFDFFSMTSVVADSQKEIECNGQQITAFCQTWRASRPRRDESLDAEPVLALTVIGGVG